VESFPVGMEVEDELPSVWEELPLSPRFGSKPRPANWIESRQEACAMQMTDTATISMWKSRVEIMMAIEAVGS
jgi:hypothetical protein